MLYCAPCQFPYSRKPDVSSKMSDNQQNQLWGGRFSESTDAFVQDVDAHFRMLKPVKFAFERLDRSRRIRFQDQRQVLYDSTTGRRKDIVQGSRLTASC